MKLEQISKSCVHEIDKDCKKEVCPYRDKKECKDYFPLERTNRRYSHLRLYNHE